MLPIAGNPTLASAACMFYYMPVWIIMFSNCKLHSWECK